MQPWWKRMAHCRARRVAGRRLNDGGGRCFRRRRIGSYSHIIVVEAVGFVLEADTGTGKAGSRNPQA
jgi:hypothetical protein